MLGFMCSCWGQCNSNHSRGMVKLERDLRPSHFLLKIQSYSLLVDSHMESYESDIFEAGGYKWRLVFYPSRKNHGSEIGTNYISLYLRIAEFDTFPPDWEVNVCFKLYVQDQKRDKYFTIQDAAREVKRFHALKTESGFPNFLSVDTLKDPSKGYLVNDCCVFGAEVFVVQCTGKSESFSMIKPRFRTKTFTWKIENFAASKEYLESKTFEVGGRSWKLAVYPKGNSVAKDCVSLYLRLDDSNNLPTKEKVYATFKLRIRDQKHSKHFERTAYQWFHGKSKCWGFSEFISLKNVNNASKRYIMNDTLVVEVEFMAVSATTVSSQVKQLEQKLGIAEIVEMERDLRPSHFLLKIQSYSSLLDNHMQSYESNIFEAGGYKWRLVFYPSGKNQISGSGTNHISLYLRIAEFDTFPPDWEVNVCFKLYVQDQTRDKYFTIQDAAREVKRFHALKTESGFPNFLSLYTFKDPSKGYLVNDCCVFGAEVFVVQCTQMSESFSLVKTPYGTFTWKIENFAASKEYLESETFEVGRRSWKLSVYPKGDSRTKDCVSLYLRLDDSNNLPTKEKVYATFKLRIRDQKHSKHFERTASHWFHAESKGWGFGEFISLKDVNDGSKGYIVNDTLVVQVEIMAVSATTSTTLTSQVKQDHN
ncbi:MATH domain and coiled-coil domain-containing protein [Senna tora]|uniref:MATH domain and coiled-coil domain-containing protein n=1 Tax=Senna tora TaxID=362788 RepID=A0A835CFW3_9FABA|nr:MATH domain and coiled-coil domain-containing protein [Senna tora]